MIPEADRLHYVVMLFDPPASEWIFNYRKNYGFVTWPEFLEDVRHRFDLHGFKNFTGRLQSCSDHHSGRLSGHLREIPQSVSNLKEEALIPIFIRGLKQPIQEKVELQHLASLAEAMALALRLAATQDDRQHQPSTVSRWQWSGRENRFTAAMLPVLERRRASRWTALGYNQSGCPTLRSRRGPAVGSAGIALRNGYRDMFVR